MGKGHVKEGSVQWRSWAEAAVLYSVVLFGHLCGIWAYSLLYRLAGKHHSLGKVLGSAALGSYLYGLVFAVSVFTGPNGLPLLVFLVGLGGAWLSPYLLRRMTITFHNETARPLSVAFSNAPDKQFELLVERSTPISSVSFLDSVRLTFTAADGEQSGTLNVPYRVMPKYHTVTINESDVVGEGFLIAPAA